MCPSPTPEVFFQKISPEALPPLEGIHVWRFFPETHDPSLLSPEERARAAGYQAESARLTFTSARSGLRQAASLYTRIPPRDLRIGIDKNGKPFFENAALHFNLSHSGSAVVAAFAGFPLGIDIESHGRCRNFVEIARRYFHPSEADRLARCGEEHEFLRLWSGKEAMLKLSGEGISGGLTEARPGDGEPGTLCGREVCLTAFRFGAWSGTVASFERAKVKGWFQF